MSFTFGSDTHGLGGSGGSRGSGTDDSMSAVTTDAIKLFASPVLMLAVMWLVRIADFVMPGRFTSMGLRAWDFSSWYGVLTMPFLHASWPHLLANTLPFLILGLLVAARGVWHFWIVTLTIMVVGSLGPFFIARPGAVTVGASGLIFGYFGYLAVSAFFARTWSGRITQGVIALVIIAIYGVSMLFGMLPQAGHVSWQGHLFGLIGGIVAAWLIGRKLNA